MDRNWKFKGVCTPQNVAMSRNSVVLSIEWPYRNDELHAKTNRSSSSADDNVSDLVQRYCPDPESANYKRNRDLALRLLTCDPTICRPSRLLDLTMLNIRLYKHSRAPKDCAIRCSVSQKSSKLKRASSHLSHCESWPRRAITSICSLHQRVFTMPHQSLSWWSCILE